MQQLATKAYAQPSATIKSSRAIEYDLFAQVTHALTKAAQPDAPTTEKVAALHNNRIMWAGLAGLIADPANALADDLRAGLLNLAQFTIAHTQKVLSKGAEVEPLVEVNAAVMAGLRPGGGT